MTILYKICLYEERLTKNGNRPCTNSIYELVFTCLNSLLKQMDGDDEIVFFCDGDDYIEELNLLCSHYKVNFKILTFNYRDAAKIHNETTSYIRSNVVQDMIYMCEDDYLHFDKCLSKIKEFLTKYPDYFCHPIDYPNLYENDPRFIYDSQIILSDTHHWRSIRSTTYTIAFTKSLFNLHIGIFKILNGYFFGEHGINLLYVFNKCFSPIPSLSSHISADCLPYITDTHDSFDNNLKELKCILFSFK
jgi:hypothetical protein